MTTSEQPTHLTLGDVARRLKLPANRVDYAIRAYRIEPVARAGILRLFSEDQLERIAAAVRRCASRPAPGRPADA